MKQVAEVVFRGPGGCPEGRYQNQGPYRGRDAAAVSRPTGLAVRLAEASGLTLVALLRGRTANVYAHPEGLTGPD